MGVVFVDTETTGLDPRRHEIWEIAIIEESGTEHLWYPTLEHLENADLIALNIGKWKERSLDKSRVYDDYHFNLDNFQIAEQVMKLTWGQHLVGAVPSFDEERLRNFLHRWKLCGGWHYHLIDVEALAIGYLRGKNSWPINDNGEQQYNPPWKSDHVWNAIIAYTRANYIDREDEKYAKHTAMGDARLVKDLYELIMLG